MRNGLKKVMALMMTLMMILSLVPATVFADTTSNTVVVNGVAPQADGDGQETTQDGEKKGTCSIVINYVFANGSQAANPWTATIAKGSSYKTDITSPTVVGYTPDQTVVNIDVTDIQQNVTYTVTYYPAEVNFTVRHYQQNVDNDQYTLVETETKTGYTESEVGAALAKTYDGFTALLYDATTKIAADGSTEVEIYYDRNYYLLSLDLNGGYGADPVYARYGAAIAIDDPVKAGYTFGGWTPAKPETMPASDMTLTAQWNAGQASYLVQYWLENANDDNYSYDSSVQRSAAVGSSVSGSNDKSYDGFNFDHADQNVTVKGDGTSVVNVYYKRKTYTLTFQVKEGSGYWSSWVTKAEFTNIKYGADTSQWWNQAPSGYRWKTSKNGNTAYTYAPAMPNSNLTVYGESVSTNYKYTIHYYEENTTNKVKDDNVYYRSSNGYYLTDEDYIYIPGFTCLNSGETQANGNLEYSIYYRRNSYTLDFNNHGEVVRSETILYDYALSGYNFTPDYPNGLEPNAYTFGGWYTDPGFLEPVDWDNAKMPYNNTVFYAKWNPIQHTVTFAKNEGEEPEKTETVDHGALAPEYTTTNGNYKFIGWFYKENGVEKAYTSSMQIRKDLNLYAKWSYNKLMEYTIKYTLEDGTVIATETTGSALAGTTKTFDAKAGDQLYEGYRTGYFPQTNSHSLTMDINGGNEFTFIYVLKDKVRYVVRYLEKGTGTVLHEEKIDVTSDAVITEKFVTVSGHRPDAYQKRLVLSADESQNVLIFWYVKDDVHAPVQIIHWTQNIAGDGYTEYQSSTDLNGVIGNPYSADPLTIPGYTYNAEKSNPSGTLTADGLVLNLYYDRIEYPYEFRFLEQGTDNVLAEAVTGSARYQAQVTQTAKVIPGYTLVSQENQAINIAIEDPADVASKNVRTFYYAENTVNITYVAVQPAGAGNTLSSYADNNVKAVTGTVEGSTPKPASTYKFVGWFTDEACTTPVDPAWVDANGMITPQKETLVEGQPAMGYKAATYYAKFERSVTNVTVRKQVTGNFGDTNKYFNFRIEVSGHNLVVVDANKEYRVATESDQNAKDSLPVQLKNGEFFTIKDVPIDGTLTVVESAVDGYQTSYKIGEETVSGNEVTYTVPETGGEILFTNHKEAQPDTGVLLDSLPYILIIACVAAIGAFIVIRRRKNRED